MTTYETLAQWTMEADRIVFFGGAGVSTESGIPDFRSSEGLFMQETGRHYSAEEAVSHSFLVNHPAEFFDFYFENLVYPEAEPNRVHYFLKKLEDLGKEVAVVTQNIDGLHQKAGSSEVYELHGSTLRNYCVSCGQFYETEDLVLDEEGIPRCEKDGAMVRPDVVLYQESLDTATLLASQMRISQADLMIIAGTSLAVYPAAGLVGDFQGDQLVLINKTPVTSLKVPDLEIIEGLDHVVRELEKVEDSFRMDGV